VLALYDPPFRFERGYIFDANSHAVADEGGAERFIEAVIRLRGWGRIGYMPKADELHDAVGEVLAEALTRFWESARAPSPKGGG
jgi:hypothetical protein